MTSFIWIYLDSLSLPAQVNIFIRFYVNWAYHIATCSMYFIILFTPALFFIGMCVYIAEMVNNFRTSVTELNAAATKLTKQLFEEQILFHRELFG